MADTNISTRSALVPGRRVHVFIWGPPTATPQQQQQISIRHKNDPQDDGVQHRFQILLDSKKQIEAEKKHLKTMKEQHNLHIDALTKEYRNRELDFEQRLNLREYLHNEAKAVFKETAFDDIR